VFRAEVAHSPWQAGGIFRTCVWPVSCKIGQLHVSPCPCCGHRHRPQYSIVCLCWWFAVQSKTWVSTWRRMTDKPRVWHHGVLHRSSACPVAMCSCAMVGPLRCCVCMLYPPSTRVGPQWIRVYVGCAHQRICISSRHITASLVHVLMAGSCPVLKSASRSCCIMLPPRFLIGGAVLQARPRCTRLHGQ